MLLLTPYVASLRLNNSTNSMDEQPSQQTHIPDESTSAGEQSDDLLSKFMKSININHECKSDTIQDSQHQQQKHQDRQRLESDFVRFSSTNHSSSSEFSARKIATLPMPIDCLKDCQIAYCELQQFIFIYMQELQQVSTFKMRLLQKRIDLFARISLSLFGPSLNSLRQFKTSTTTKAPHVGLEPQHLVIQVDQSQILRQVYDVWLANQYEPQFLLEANERLIVSKPIQQLCHDTLQKLSLHMRKSLANSSNFGETHVHALLYSDTKLISHFACRNSQPLNQDDLILLLLFLKSYLISQQDKKSLTSTDTRSNPNYCYASNFQANKRTYEINSQSNSTLSQQQLERFDFPPEILIYLSTPGKLKCRVRVPHMLRFATLASGVTLILISEISSSYLCFQMGRLLGLLQEFNKINFVGGIKLSQLATVNDCVCAIKSYFYGQNYDQVLSKKSYSGDDENVELESQQTPPPVGLLNVISRYFRRVNSADGDVVAQQENTVYHNLNDTERRLCRQLMSRLEELMSNNVHTYMRRTFNREVDERKREALLTSISATLRESLNTFVMQPQLNRLGQIHGNYAKNFANLIDECKLMAKKDLSDYLDYLSVKQTCNLTLGAPLTHDMPAVKSFIYVDRNRQQLLVAPMRRNLAQMDQGSLLEADFWNAMSRSTNCKVDREKCSSSSFDTSSDEESQARDGGSEIDSDSSAVSSINPSSIYPTKPFNLKKRVDCKNTRLSTSKSTNNWSLGASGDILTKSEIASPSSSCSQSTGTGSSACDLLMTRYQTTGSVMDHGINYDAKTQSNMDLSSETASMVNSMTEKHQQQQLVDENLMKGFTCFIYNRLANGKTSFSSNDGTYVYSYFLWFKRNSVRSFSP